MPLHLTKIAFGAESPATLHAWLKRQAANEWSEARLTTRYLPKRVGEMVGGSLYWIHQHVVVGRSPLLGFAPTPEGRQWIRLEPRLIVVHPQARRAHQGWRYLDEADAPSDLDHDATGDALPSHLVSELARLGLV